MSQVSQELQTMEAKYFDLVWYARRNPDPESVSELPPNILVDMLANMRRIESKYPAEVEELQSPIGDWTHGFNSGMLAALRWIMTANEDGVDQANEEFPFLDT